MIYTMCKGLYNKKCSHCLYLCHK